MWWHGLAVQDARPSASKGFRPPFGLWRVTLERPALFKKCTKGLLPRLFARLRRVPSAHPLVRRHAPTGLWPSPSMASAKVRFEHPCSRAKSGRAALTLFRFGPWPGAARSTSCLAAWTSGLASANKSGNQNRARHNLRGIIGCNKWSALPPTVLQCPRH